MHQSITRSTADWRSYNATVTYGSFRVVGYFGVSACTQMENDTARVLLAVFVKSDLSFGWF